MAGRWELEIVSNMATILSIGVGAGPIAWAKGYDNSGHYTTIMSKMLSGSQIGSDI
jgi:hypothetical protein